MANIVAAARSNHFRVADEAAFLAWAGTLPGVSAHRATPRGAEADGPDHPHPYYALLADGSDTGGWPTFRDAQVTCLPKGCGQAGCDDHTCQDAYADDEPIDLPAELAPHLAEGHVAVLEEVGHEKLRYVYAVAVAVNHRGETIALHLDDVYDRAKAAGWASHIPTAAY